MKLYYLNLCLLILLLSCSNSSNKEQESKIAKDTTAEKDGNRERELASLESEMINFFQETLEKNYGRKDAVDLLMKGLDKYYHNYILDVDKPQLQKINEKLYSKGWLYSYFLNGKDVNDSCLLFVPEGMTGQQYQHSAKYQQDLKRKNMDGSTVAFAPDSARYMSYAPDRARVENMNLPLIMYAKDDFSYFRRELVHASHPTMKKMAEMLDAVSGDASSSVVWGMLSYNSKSICTDFKSDRDIQMLMTLYFWKYLCHSANIDFYSGKDRTQMLLEEEGQK